MIPDTVKQDRRQRTSVVPRETMALFFDADWFDERLAARGLARAVLAAAAGLSDAHLAEVFKDQRALSAGQVTIFAELLGETPADVAARAGVSTPVPGRPTQFDARLADLEQQMRRMDPNFQPAALNASLAARLEALERRSPPRYQAACRCRW